MDSTPSRRTFLSAGALVSLATLSGCSTTDSDQRLRIRVTNESPTSHELVVRAYRDEHTLARQYVSLPAGESGAAVNLETVLLVENASKGDDVHVRATLDSVDGRYVDAPVTFDCTPEYRGNSVAVVVEAGDSIAFRGESRCFDETTGFARTSSHNRG
ncbi:hypothetical protein [Haloarchaeobius sp. TZWSO28]|uniref:hypothetical protein n=1 Tax=unclassified Haloarchaeobius TaxID=2614452 RepID=UPI003EBB348C